MKQLNRKLTFFLIGLLIGWFIMSVLGCALKERITSYEKILAADNAIRG